MFRITDITITDNILARSFGLNRILIHTSDRNRPIVYIGYLKKENALRFDKKLDELVTKQRELKRVPEIDHDIFSNFVKNN